MATLNDLARQHTGFGAAERAHLRRLVGSWGPLADLGFADLLLFAPSIRSSGNVLVVLGQLRPATAQTLYLDDQVGQVIERADRPLVEQALATGVVQEKEVDLATLGRRVRVTAVPIRLGSDVVAVMTLESGQLEDRARSDLELAYFDVAARICNMMTEGTFPFPFEDAVTEESPRVGDGALVLEDQTRVVYSSPNAVSALHRMGYHGRIADRRLDELGFDGDVVASAYRLRVPVIEEVERGDNVTILSRILPLIEDGRVTGALVLLRDVSDIRRRDRMLVSMDTTIKEIHHRVKNNLQTVSSLLRIQGRRVEVPEAKAAIEESVRRIQSIAVVHEMLANSGGDDVVFTDVVKPIMDMAESTLVAADRPIKFHLVGEGPTLSARKASSLAVVVMELLHNAIEHGFPAGTDGGSVTVDLVTSPTDLRVRVHDDGVGVTDDFRPEAAGGLGLTIISSLVSGELGGELLIRPANPPQRGTRAEVKVLLNDED